MSTFYIASLKHTNRDHEHITFWGALHRGYTPVVGGKHAGLYCYGEAVDLNDGLDYIAVPAEVVQSLMQPEPYFLNYKDEPARFYDQRGGVINNSRVHWDALIAQSLKAGRYAARVKPEVFRRKPRSFGLATQAPNTGEAHER